MTRRRKPKVGPHYALTDQEVDDEWMALAVRARMAGYDQKQVARWLGNKWTWPVTRKRGCLPAIRKMVEDLEKAR